MSKTAFEQLSDKKKLFVTEYIIDLDQTRAAREAGYKRPGELGCRLKKDRLIVRAIEELLGPTMAANQLTKDKVVAQLGNFLFRSIKDFIGEDGYLVLNPAKLPDSVAQCVEGWEAELLTEWDNENQCRIVVGQRIKVKLVSKSKMQELAMKYCGLLQPELMQQNNFNVNVFDWKAFYAQQQAIDENTLDPLEAKIQAITPALKGTTNGKSNGQPH